MYKVNSYLIRLTIKYIFINLLIISIFILFLNLIELSRILNFENNTLTNYLKLSALKYPSILNEILPFVIIISIAFLFRNLINNNELISMRNIGFSIFDIFIPIGFTVFISGLFFLFILNPISSTFEMQYEKLINKNNKSLYSIKLSNKEMWINNKIDENKSSFISIERINLKSMKANNIKILSIKDRKNIFLQAESGIFKDNIFFLESVKYFEINNENYQFFDDYSLQINFSKQNIINSITNYKLIPFYNYFSHLKTLKKFNLYSSEIALFYLSEILKPFFILMLAFVVIGYSGKFKRNENFFKVLFISILIGFLIFFLKELISKISINLSMNFFISYLIIFLLPFTIGLYQVIKIEND